jgi:hypothetical protein
LIALCDFENNDRYDWVTRPIVKLPRDPAPPELTQHQIADRDVAVKLAALSEFPKMLRWLSARKTGDRVDRDVANIFWLDPAYALAPERRPRSKAEAARLLGLSRNILDRRRAAIIKRFSGMEETELRARVPGFATGPRAYEHVDFPIWKIAKILEFCGPIYDWRRNEVGICLTYDQIAETVEAQNADERRLCEWVEAHNEFTQAPINTKFLEPAALEGAGVAETNVADGPKARRVRYVVDGGIAPQVTRDRLIEIGVISLHRTPGDDDGIFYRGTGSRPLRSFEIVRPVLNPWTFALTMTYGRRPCSFLTHSYNNVRKDPVIAITFQNDPHHHRQQRSKADVAH